MDFNKSKLVIRHQMIGAGYHDALVAMEFAELHHTGLRKDGKTPEFQHQTSIALYAMTLPDLRWREEVLATIWLHDTREDYGITDAEIYDLFPNRDKGRLIADAVDAMTKTFRGVKRNEAMLFETMGKNPIASIAKGCDRINNIGSMVGVFTPEKQRKYIGEVRDLFFPMLKSARRLFPYQVRAYENIKFVLKSQIDLIEASLDGQGH